MSHGRFSQGSGVEPTVLLLIVVLLLSSSSSALVATPAHAPERLTTVRPAATPAGTTGTSTPASGLYPASIPGCGACEPNGTPTLSAGQVNASCSGLGPYTIGCGSGTWFTLSISTPTCCDLLLLEISDFYQSGGALTGANVMDSNLLLWQTSPALTVVNAGNSLTVFYAVDPTAGTDTVTVAGGSISAATAVGMLFAFQGVDASNPLGAGTPASQTGYGTSPAVSVVTNVADAAVVGFFGMNSTPSIATTSGFTAIGAVATPPSSQLPSVLQEYAEYEGAPTAPGPYTSSPALSGGTLLEELGVALEPTCGCEPNRAPAVDGSPSTASCAGAGCALSGPWFTLSASPSQPDDVLLLAVTMLDGPNPPSPVNVVSCLSPGPSGCTAPSSLPWALTPNGLAPYNGRVAGNMSLFWAVDPNTGPVYVTFTTAANPVTGEAEYYPPGAATESAALLASFSGVDPFNPLGGGTPVFSSSSPLPMSITTVASDTMVVGVTWQNSTGLFTSTPGFTEVGTAQASANPSPYNPQVDEEAAPEPTPGSVTLNPTLSLPPSGAVLGELAIALLPNCTPPTYPVTFTESGLPSKVLAKDGWTVDLKGFIPTWSTQSSIAFANVTNGSYTAWITGPAGYRVTGGASGTSDFRAPWRVSGPTVIGVSFVKGRTLALRFHEKGLPKPSDVSPRALAWGVSLLGSSFYYIPTYDSTYRYLNLTPGTYNYTVASTLGGQNITQKLGPTVTYGPSGTIALTKSTMVQLTFAYRYAVTFTESGLSGGSWSVTVHGVTMTRAYNDPIVFNETNGTYGYKVGTISGYVSSGSPKKVVVPTRISVSVTFTDMNEKPVSRVGLVGMPPVAAAAVPVG